MRGVDALDVEHRIGLGVPEALRLREHHVERQSLVAHLRENVIAGAIDDPRDPFDAVGGEPFADRLDDGHAARDASLEGDHHALGVGPREDFRAVLGEQRLVGGDDVLAVVDRLQHQVARGGVAADELDHDVDVRASDDEPRGGHELDALERDRSLLGQVARARHLDHDIAPGAARDLLAIAAQHLDRAAADRAEAEQTYLDGFH